MNVFGGGDPDYTKTSYLLTQEGIDSFCYSLLFAKEKFSLKWWCQMFDKCSSQINKGLNKQNAHSLIKVTVGGNSKIPLNVCFIKWVIEAAIYMF